MSGSDLQDRLLCTDLALLVSGPGKRRSSAYLWTSRVPFAIVYLIHSNPIPNNSYINWSLARALSLSLSNLLDEFGPVCLF